MNSLGNKGFNQYEIISGTNNRGNSGSNWSSLRKGFILEVDNDSDTMIVLVLEHDVDSFEYAIKEYQNCKAYFQNWLPNYEDEYKREQEILKHRYGKLKREDYEDIIDNYNKGASNKKRIDLILLGEYKPHELSVGMKLKPTDVYSLRYDKGYFHNTITITKVGNKNCTFISDSHSIENMSRRTELLSDPVYFDVVDEKVEETCDGKLVEIEGKKYTLNLVK